MRTELKDNKYPDYTFEQLDLPNSDKHLHWLVYKGDQRGDDFRFLSRNGEWEKCGGDGWFKNREDITHFLDTGELPKPKQHPDTLAIWWTNQSNCEQVCHAPETLKGLPAYLRRQLKDRYGRAGRARLWIDKTIDFHGIKGEKDYSEYVRGDYAGIVIKRRDLDKLRSQFSGKFTDVELKPLTAN